ncbi:MAG: uridine diphosphate-N-acetylglucosamine-binding protein YvcK [Deinococcaceae bacterium]
MNWRRSIREVEKQNPKAARAAKWLSSDMGVKRYFTVLLLSLVFALFGFLHFVWTGPWRFIATRWILLLNNLTNPEVIPLWVVGLTVTVLAVILTVWSVVQLNRSLLRSSGVLPEEAADRIYVTRFLAKGPKVVALGGGTGLSNLLGGLKEYSRNITAVVAVTDDGGSSGKLRKDLGMIAPGDLTDCYAALSDSPVLARLLLHRFKRGDGIEGHTFGNLMLATLSEEEGSLEGTVQDVNKILNVRGQVLPATFESAVLVAHLVDGSEVRGESILADERRGRKVQRMSLEPADVRPPQEVIQAIRDADALIIGPGSLFTSLIPAILVAEVAQAIRESSAPLIYIANLFSEAGETDGLNLEEHHDVLATHLGRQADLVLVNGRSIDARTIARYRSDGCQLLTDEDCSYPFRLKVRHAPLVRPGSGQHDPELLAQALLRYIPRLKWWESLSFSESTKVERESEV